MGTCTRGEKEIEFEALLMGLVKAAKFLPSELEKAEITFDNVRRRFHELRELLESNEQLRRYLVTTLCPTTRYGTSVEDAIALLRKLALSDTQKQSSDPVQGVLEAAATHFMYARDIFAGVDLPTDKRDPSQEATPRSKSRASASARH